MQLQLNQRSKMPTKFRGQNGRSILFFLHLPWKHFDNEVTAMQHISSRYSVPHTQMDTIQMVLLPAQLLARSEAREYHHFGWRIILTFTSRVRCATFFISMRIISVNYTLALQMCQNVSNTLKREQQNRVRGKVIQINKTVSWTITETIIVFKKSNVTKSKSGNLDTNAYPLVNLCTHFHFCGVVSDWSSTLSQTKD